MCIFLVVSCFADRSLFWIPSILEHCPQYIKCTAITDLELDAKITHAKSQLSGFGERMVLRFLNSKGIRVSRDRIRAAIDLVDLQGVAERQELQNRRIRRRVYSVPCPCYIWHLDGNHKFIRWGLVIHAAIDGFCRTCTYLRCIENNQLVTVCTCFADSIELFGVRPKRVRIDHGLENAMVWEAMRECSDKKSVLLGSYVHNQRVEQFNREINHHIRLKYASIYFYPTKLLLPLARMGCCAVLLLRLPLAKGLQEWANLLSVGPTTWYTVASHC